MSNQRENPLCRAGVRPPLLCICVPLLRGASRLN